MLYVKIKKYKIFTKKIIKKLEEKYNAKYIEDFEKKNGNIASLFYREFQNVELGDTNYFLLTHEYISNGEYIKNIVFNAVKSKKTYLISCDRHHFNQKDDV